MRLSFVILLLLAIAIIAQVADAKIYTGAVPCNSTDWVYNPAFEVLNGPDCQFSPQRWFKVNPWCRDIAANRQSPIKLELSKCTKKSTALKRIKLGPGWYKNKQFVVKNKGETLQADVVDSTDMTVRGGNLKGEFNCVQLHFHWGSPANINKGIGSEHELFDAGGRKVPAPMEMHVVCKNASMDISKALITPDAIAVLGVFIQAGRTKQYVDEWSNDAIKTLILNFLAAKKTSDSNNEVRVELWVRDMLPENLREFVNYDGSLTTPTCNPVVQWHLFTSPIVIRKRWMLKFTKLFFDSDEKRQMVDNFRPLMQLHGRKVRCSFANK